MAFMVAGPLLRAVRAAVFAAVCVTLSVAGHAWMSGCTVAPWAVMAAGAGVLACAFALAGRRRGYGWIAASMLTAQALLHELFARAQGAPSTSTGLALAHHVGGLVANLLHPPQSAASAWSAMPMPAGMTMPGMSMPAAPSAGSSGAGMCAMGHGAWGMIAAHAAAGLVCSWWLARGEARIFGLLSALVLALFAPLLLAAEALGGWVARPCRPVRAFAAVRTVYSPLLAYTVVRRGPPVCAARI
jgi:hypothetical protein